MSGKQYADRLEGYVEVKDRIKQFYDKHPDGRLVTAEVLMHDAAGKQRVQVKALAYRTVDDPLPAVGYSWMELPGTTPYTRGSELENTETSAWGRAIGALGIGIDKSIASQQEVAGKERDAATRAEDAVYDSGLVGVAEVGRGRDSDFELRQTPDGWHLGFRLTDGRKGIKVEAKDALAEMVANHRAEIEGYRATAWGVVRDESFQKDGRTITYQVLALSRIKVGPLDLSEPDADEADDAA